MLDGVSELGVLEQNLFNLVAGPEAFKSWSVLVDERTEVIGSESGYSERVDVWTRQLAVHLRGEETRATRTTSKKS